MSFQNGGRLVLHHAEKAIQVFHIALLSETRSVVWVPVEVQVQVQAQDSFGCCSSFQTHTDIRFASMPASGNGKFPVCQCSQSPSHFRTRNQIFLSLLLPVFPQLSADLALPCSTRPFSIILIRIHISCPCCAADLSAVLAHPQRDCLRSR